MPTFTNPQTWVSGRVNYTDMNTYLRDNLNALKYPPTDLYQDSRSTDYSTTSTSFVDVDATNYSLSITTTGNGAGGAGYFMVGFTGTLYSTVSNRIYFRMTVAGVVMNDDDGFFVSEGSGLRPISFMFLRNIPANPTPIAINLQWKTNTSTATLLAAAGTSTRNCRSQFWVREIS